MYFNFKKKNIFISGGTHGIGLDCALSFAKLGANIITFSRDKIKILNIKRKLNSTNTKYLIEQGDILDETFVHSFSKAVLKKFKNIHILIHNVGVADAALTVLTGLTVIVPVALTVPQPPVNGIL
jgi:short-subunit dehydrogenase